MDRGKIVKPKPAAPKAGKPGSTKGVPYPTFTTKPMRGTPSQGTTGHPRPFK